VAHLGPLSDPIVLALPRGGVPVGLEVARELRAPLDVLIVRKLGVPQQPELALGAIASGDVRVLNRELLEELAIPAEVIDEVAAREATELTRREAAYRGHAAAPKIAGRSVILVDDGVATGSTMSAAIAALRLSGPREVIVAVPLAPADTCARLRSEADHVICLEEPQPFVAIGLWYATFPQMDDREVRAQLEEAARQGLASNDPARRVAS
jgi:putative phosphoribosyl transferase